MIKKLRIPLIAALVILALIAGILIWQNNRSASDDAVADEDKPLAVTRQAERRTLKREMQVSGTLERTEVQTISVATPGNISDIAIDDGDRVEVGDVIFSLDGRPGIAVQGSTPFFRSLDVGSRGPDVLQLEEALADFGYDPGPIDTLYSLETRTALAEFQADRDYPASSPEVGETITLILQSNPVAYSVGAQNSSSITIDPLLSPPAATGGASVAFRQPFPSISIQTSSLVATEGSVATYTVVASAPSTVPITVALGFSGGATNGTDYQPPIPAQVTIPAGSLTASFTVQTIQDGAVEGIESFDVNVLLDPAPTKTYNVAAAPNNSASTEILDDDQPTMNISSTGNVVEGQTGTFTITADQPVLSDTTVTLVTPVTSAIGGANGAATSGTDYVSYPTVVTIPAGQTSVTIPIDTLVDADVEGDEEIVVEIEASPGYFVGTQDAALMTLQDGTTVTVPVVTIEADSNDTAEGGVATFTIRTTAALATPYDVAWTIGGTAISGDDYDPPTTLVTTIAANATTAAVNIGLNDDDVVEADRTISVSLSPGADYTLGATTTDQTIIEDNDSPELNITGTTTVREGQRVSVTITADQAPLTDTDITLSVQGTAQSNSDYEPVSSRVTLPAGSTIVTVPFTILTDTSIEPNEEINVTVQGGGAQFSVGDDATATITITDSVGTGVGPVLTINSSTADVPEGSQVTFTIGASVPSTREIDVEISLSGTATNNVDYTFPTQDLVLSPGQTQIQIPVIIRQDDVIEPDQDIIVTLLPGAGYTIAQPDHAHVNIVDDDVPELTLTGGDEDLAEGSEAVFVIRADQPSFEPMSVNYQVVGSAQPGLDFETLSGTAIMPAGETELIIPVRTLNDDVVFIPTDMIAAEWPGRAGKIFIEEGQSLVDGAPLFEITEDEFSIRLALSPNQRAEMSVGMVAEVEIDASDLSTVGEISELDENATIDGAGVETYDGRVDISTEFAAVDGSQARITVVIEEAANAVVVPVAAVFQSPDGDAVRVIDLDSGEIGERLVTTGLDEDSFVEIEDGLREGELVIIEVN